MSDDNEYTPPPPRTPPSYFSAKQKAAYFDILVQIGAENIAGITKRKRVGAASRPGFDRVVGAVRILPRGANSHYQFFLTFLYGPRAAWGAPTVVNADEGDEFNEIDDQAEYEECFRIFLQRIKDLEPVLKHLYINSLRDPQPWNALSDRLKSAAEDTRSTDTKDFLKHTADLVVPTQQHVLYPVLSREAGKSDRGLSHESLRPFLITWKQRNLLPPIAWAQPHPERPSELYIPPQPDFVWTDEANALVKSMDDQTIKFSCKKSPSFLWDNYTAGQARKGMFRSYVFIRGYRLMFTGKKTIFKRGKGMPAKDSATRICNFWTVTPRSIACVACQIRVMLTKEPWTASYNPESKAFNYPGFFKFLVGLFSEPGFEDWAKETIEFVHSPARSMAMRLRRKTAPETDEDESDDDFVAERRERAAANFTHTHSVIARMVPQSLNHLYCLLSQIDHHCILYPPPATYSAHVSINATRLPPLVSFDVLCVDDYAHSPG
ncbi:hypothetical protein MKEN_00977700 [Mycena kentingensis (nom. inval.)]|nr:hypothetical protein MKEN_00977700 [Mycena kentingensis (nom. inval.)]